MEEQKKRRARRKFTEEFKARAVRLVLKDGQTAAQVARDLDLVESVLHGWIRQAKIAPRGTASLPVQIEGLDDLYRRAGGDGFDERSRAVGQR